MPVVMVALNLKKNGEWIARKAIPVDARPEYKRLFGVSREAILRVPRGTSKSQAKAQHGQWLAEVETRIERIRASVRGEGTCGLDFQSKAGGHEISRGKSLGFYDPGK